MSSKKNSKEIFKCRVCKAVLVRNQNITPLMYQKVMGGDYWQQYCTKCDKRVDRSFKIAEQQEYKKILKSKSQLEFEAWSKDRKLPKPKVIKKEETVSYGGTTGIQVEKSSLKGYTCEKCNETKISKNPPKDNICPKCTEKEIKRLRNLLHENKKTLIIPSPSKNLINFLILNYPFKYDNYQEILRLEIGKQYSKKTAYTDESIVKEYYNQLGHLGTRIVVKCDECNYKFSYLYKGGPKRGLCPECRDWTKAFPLEPTNTYWVVKSNKVKIY